MSKKTLHDVTGHQFLKEIRKQIDKYLGTPGLRSIPTCDIADVDNWLDKAEKKVIKKASK